MTDLNLVCEDPFNIGLLGAMSFISFAVGSAFITRLADIYGRKLVVILSSMVTPLGIIVMIYLAKSLIALYVLIFIIGLSYNARGSTAYIYGQEFLAPKWRTPYSICTFVMIGVNQLLCILVFYITQSQDLFLWIIVVLMALSISWVVVVAPESPEFLYSKSDFD